MKRLFLVPFLFVCHSVYAQTDVSSDTVTFPNPAPPPANNPPATLLNLLSALPNLYNFGATMTGTSADNTSYLRARTGCSQMLVVPAGTLPASLTTATTFPGGCSYADVDLFNGTKDSSGQSVTALGQDLGLAVASTGGLLLTRANSTLSPLLQAPNFLTDLSPTAQAGSDQDNLYVRTTVPSITLTTHSVIGQKSVFTTSAVGSGYQMANQLYFIRPPRSQTDPLSGTPFDPAFAENIVFSDNASTTAGGVALSGGGVNIERDFYANGADDAQHGIGTRILEHLGTSCALPSGGTCIGTNTWGEIGSLIDIDTTDERQYWHVGLAAKGTWKDSFMDLSSGLQMVGGTTLRLASNQRISLSGDDSKQLAYQPGVGLAYSATGQSTALAFSIPDGGGFIAGQTGATAGGVSFYTPIMSVTNGIVGKQGSVSSIAMNDGGLFTATGLPTLSVSAPLGGSDAATISATYGLGQVIFITDGGAGCSTGDVLTLSGGTLASGGTPAQVTLSGTPVVGSGAAVQSGHVGHVTITNPGNYSVPPTGVITTTGGTCTTQPQFQVAWGFVQPTITHAGSGYAAFPSPIVTATATSGGTIFRQPAFNIVMAAALSPLAINGGLKVSATGTLGLTPSTPADNATCTAGQITVDGSYVYACTSTNTWKRAALANY